MPEGFRRKPVCESLIVAQVASNRALRSCFASAESTQLLFASQHEFGPPSYAGSCTASQTSDAATFSGKELAWTVSTYMCFDQLLRYIYRCRILFRQPAIVDGKSRLKHKHAKWSKLSVCEIRYSASAWHSWTCERRSSAAVPMDQRAP